MRMRRRMGTGLAAALAAFAAAGATPAFACSCNCPSDLSIDERIAEFDLVFRGVATDVSYVVPDGARAPSRKRVTFQVGSIYRGRLGDEVVVETGFGAQRMSCPAVRYFEGDEAMIIAHVRSDGTAVPASWCARMCLFSPTSSVLLNRDDDREPEASDFLEWLNQRP